MARTQIPGEQVKDGGIDTADLAPNSVTTPKIAPTGVGAGTYRSITVNDRGQATAGSNPTTLAGYGITDAALASGSYVTVNAEAALPNERALTGTARVTVTDGGGNSTVTLDLGAAGTPGTYRSVTTDVYGRVTAGTNPTTLAGYGITDAQPLDAGLTALAAFNTNGILVQTANDTFVGRSLAQPAAGLTITNPAGTAGNPTFALANDLAALEALAGTGLAVRTGADAWATRAIAGTTNRLTVANGDGVAGAPTLDISAAYAGQASIVTLGTVTTGTWQGTTVATGFGGTGLAAIGAANQVLGVNAGATGLEYKTIAAGTGVSVTPAAGSVTIASTVVDGIDAVRVASTANLTLTAPGAAIDGVTLANGDRVLVKDQTAPAENGIYVFNGAAAAMTRAADMSADWNATVPGRDIYVTEGTLSATFNWRTSAALGGTFGATAMPWTGTLNGFGKLLFGNSATPARAASGPFGQRGFTFIDSTSYGRIWRWQNVSVGNSSGMEFITGDNEDAANAGNYWWDVSMHVADQEGMRFARRTGSGNPTPKLLLSATGQLTIGDAVLTGTTTGLSFATNTGTDLYVNGVAGARMPSGTTAQRPASPVAATTRFNTTLGVQEVYNGTAWVPPGKVLQVVQATVASLSSNSQIPYDNTTPLSTEGVAVWSQAFTPLVATSTIVIISSGFLAVNSANDVFVTGSLFSGTTCIAASLLAFTTNTGEGGPYSLHATTAAGSTAARTYSMRAGPNSNVTVFYQQGTGGQAYGGVQTASYIILEIAA